MCKSSEEVLFEGWSAWLPHGLHLSRDLRNNHLPLVSKMYYKMYVEQGTTQGHIHY